VEPVTNELEEEAFAYIKKSDDMGGRLAAIDCNYSQIEIAVVAYKY
jgi:methylmalonyl-CoA mutase, N-terminal domain